jgi:hypothetical protein
MDQHATQIDVAALADAEQLLLASGGVLPWHDSKPSSEVASATKSGAVTDGGHGGGRDQRAAAGNLTELPAASSLLMRSISSVIT